MKFVSKDGLRYYHQKYVLPAIKSHVNRINITGQTLDVNTLTLSDGSSNKAEYIEKTNGGAANITNTPVANTPFVLVVELIRWASASDYITKQTFYTSTVTYTRICTSGTWGNWAQLIFTDTKNTAGSTDTSSKIFLIGATSQAANPQTYSHNTAYVDTNGHLYSNSKQVVNVSDTQALTNKTYNGYTLAAACAKAVTDSSSASAIGTGTSLVTERDVYYGLPTINGAHNYTSSTNIYAPTSVGTSGYILKSGGSGAPSWVAQSSLSVGSATKATNDSDGKAINTTYLKLTGGTITADGDNSTYGKAALNIANKTSGSSTIFPSISFMQINKSDANLVMKDYNFYRKPSTSSNYYKIYDENNMSDPIMSGAMMHDSRIGTTGSSSFVWGTTSNTASGNGSVAMGYDNTASGKYAVAMGYSNTASGTVSFAMGYDNTASEQGSFAMGNINTASGYSSVAMGYKNTASATGSVAMGDTNTASANDSVAMGNANNVSTTTLGFAFGGNNTVTGGYGACAIGTQCKVGGQHAIATGDYSESNSWCSVAMGNQVLANGQCQAVFGHFNVSSSSGAIYGTAGDALIIGNGNGGNARSNSFRVTNAGLTYAKGAYSSTGADYAEYFEWEDGNPNNEDRRGLFVTFANKNKIRIANEADQYILGVVSAKPVIIGNTDDDDQWAQRFLKDEYGEFIMQQTEQEREVKVTDKETGEEKTEIVKEIVEFYVENPEYDPSKEYKTREQRPEWSPIGMLGVLSVHDDGTCKVNEYCKCSANGIATYCNEYTLTSYRVIERVSENIVKIVIK